jgi:post-segregation antitoxin (ccd killing protein)
MPARDDVTVRLDVGLREKARELDINLSRLLEETLREEVERRETIAETLEGSEAIRLNLEDEEGRRYVGKFTGKELGAGDDVVIYLADDERIIAYDLAKREYSVIDDLGDLENWLPRDPGVLAEVLHALGEAPELDI